MHRLFLKSDGDATEKTVWQAFFFGTSTPSTTETLAASVAAVATVVGGLSIRVSMAAAVSALSVVTGNVTVGVTFSAAVTAVSAVVGNLTIRKFFAAVVQGVSTVVGNLTVAGGAVASRAYKVYKKIQGAHRWR